MNSHRQRLFFVPAKVLLLSVVVSFISCASSVSAQLTEEQQWLSEALGFVNFEALQNSQLHQSDSTQTLWNIDQLKKSIAYFEEYEGFAHDYLHSFLTGDDSALNTSELHFQQFLLNKLYIAIEHLTSREQVPFQYSTRLGSSNRQQEAELAAIAKNLAQATTALIKLSDIYSRLGWSLNESGWYPDSQAVAMQLLDRTDRMRQQSMLYNQEALSELQNDAQLTDFLVSQRHRATFLAENYAKPAIVFLQSIGSTHHQSEPRVNYWMNTLTSIHKHRKGEPASSVIALETWSHEAMKSKPEACRTQDISAITDLFTEARQSMSQHFCRVIDD